MFRVWNAQRGGSDSNPKEGGGYTSTPSIHNSHSSVHSLTCIGGKCWCKCAKNASPNMQNAECILGDVCLKYTSRAYEDMSISCMCEFWAYGQTSVCTDRCRADVFSGNIWCIWLLINQPHQPRGASTNSDQGCWDWLISWSNDLIENPNSPVAWEGCTQWKKFTAGLSKATTFQDFLSFCVLGKNWYNVDCMYARSAPHFQTERF